MRKINKDDKDKKDTFRKRNLDTIELYINDFDHILNAFKEDNEWLDVIINPHLHRKNPDDSLKSSGL